MTAARILNLKLIGLFLVFEYLGIYLSFIWYTPKHGWLRADIGATLTMVFCTAVPLIMNKFSDRR